MAEKGGKEGIVIDLDEDGVTIDERGRATIQVEYFGQTIGVTERNPGEWGRERVDGTDERLGVPANVVAAIRRSFMDVEKRIQDGSSTESQAAA